MIIPKKVKKISVLEDVHKMLKKDRDHFSKVIGPVKWTISDTIEEYKKIINQFVEAEKVSVKRNGQRFYVSENLTIDVIPKKNKAEGINSKHVHILGKENKDGSSHIKDTIVFKNNEDFKLFVRGLNLIEKALQGVDLNEN